MIAIGENTPELLWGRVLAVQANFYRVQLETQASAGAKSYPCPELLCTRRSRLKKLGQKVMVGDYVGIEEPDWLGQRGAISQVLSRRTQLQRPPVANADQVLLMFTLAEPILDPQQLTRFLVTVESTQLRVVVCLNKRDLVGEKEEKYWYDRLYQWGYEPILISLCTGVGLPLLQQQLQHKLTVVAGPSGVGKSSLINQLVPNLDLRVGSVSERWGQGRHTTRHVELFDLPTGGLVADTPGFNQPKLDCNPQDLASYFPEAQQRLAAAHCQFTNCLHRDEPNCVVRGNWDRYPYYLSLLEDATIQWSQLADMANPETKIKLKTKHQGQAGYEPKLATKRYRRPSRKTQKQILRDFDTDIRDARTFKDNALI